MNTIKKVCCFLLLLSMVLMLAACGEVGKVEKQIDALGNISLESNDAINAAQEAFDALSDEDKAKVENVTVLEEAHKQYELAVKEKDYNDAVAAFEAGSYSQAKAMFDALGSYKDSSKRSIEAEEACYYEEALGFIAQGQYLEASDLFVKANDYSDAKQQLFDSAKLLLNDGSYADAIDVFNKSDDPACATYIEYAQGFISMADNNYVDAQKHFEAAEGIEDSNNQIVICTFLQAEANMDKGYLNTAKALYESLPADYSYEGKSVEDRLAKLEKFNSFVELCGVWKCNDMDASVRQTHDSTGLWDQWDGDGWGYELEITCLLNDDDTATMKAKANFWHYSNYSSLSKNLKNSDDSCTFTYTGTTVPTKMDYSLNFNYEYSGTLKISGKTFKLDYQILDKNSSMNFTYTYKSFGTYDTFVKAL